METEIAVRALQAIMKEVDTSGDGKISKAEFFKYFSF